MGAAGVVPCVLASVVLLPRHHAGSANGSEPSHLAYWLFGSHPPGRILLAGVPVVHCVHPALLLWCALSLRRTHPPPPPLPLAATESEWLECKFNSCRTEQ